MTIEETEILVERMRIFIETKPSSSQEIDEWLDIFEKSSPEEVKEILDGLEKLN